MIDPIIYSSDPLSKKGKIKFLKTRNVISPTRANQHDAGIDFFVPELTEQFIQVLKEKNPDLHIKFNENDESISILLDPHERILIPSGIHCQMNSPDRALIAANKSGIATKQGLVFGAQIVDYEYQGEIHLSLINTGKIPVILTSGMKILQFIETPIFTSVIDIEENKSTQEFYEKETTRGEGGFGSTDKK